MSPLKKDVPGVPFARSLVPVLSIVLAGVLVSTLLAYFYTKQTVTTLALDDTEQALRFLEREMTIKQEHIGFELKLWSSEDVFRLALENSYLGISARRAAAGRMKSRVARRSIDRMTLVSLNGDIIQASEPDMVGSFTVADREYFKQAISGELAFQTIAKGRHTGRPILIVAAPIIDVEEEVKGCLLAIVDIPTFAQGALHGLNLSASGTASILSKTGLVLASTTPEAVGAVWPPDELEKAQSSARDPESPMRRVHRGEQVRLLVARHDALNDWLLVTEADEAELLKPATRLGWFSGGVSLVTLFLVTFTLGGLQRALTRLRSSEDKFSKLFFLSPDAIVLVRMHDYIIQNANESFYRLLELADDNLEGCKVEELDMFASKDDMALVTKTLRNAGRIENFEFKVRSDNGNVRSCMLSGQVVELDAHPHIIAIIRDISELKRVHEMMLQTEKMMSLGGLAAGMAHEINNPLAGVLGYLQIVRNRLFRDTRKNIKTAQEHGLDLETMRAYLTARDIPQMLENIHISGHRAAHIVKNMLSFSRKSERLISRHDVESLLETTLELAENDFNLQKKYDFKKIKIIKEFDADTPPVYCEGGEMQQVFLNLLKNGAEAMAEKQYNHGAPCFTLRAKWLDPMVQIEIEDNGPGLDEEAQRRIFEPFYTTKGVGKGTGLGMSVSYFIIADQHGGTMEVKSPPGKGACFIIRLPAHGEEHDENASAL